MIAAAIASVAFTMIGPMQFGRMCRTMIRRLDAPDARAASTNSFSLSESTCPRTTRAMYIQPSAASTKMIDVSALRRSCWMRDREQREVGHDRGRGR